MPRSARALLRRVAVVILTAGLCIGCASERPAPAGATRTVVDIEGTSVETPEQPQRVVTLSEPTLDAALALGITPIGTVTGRGQGTVPAYLADRAGDIEILGSVAQPNYEAIGAVQPDLILVDGTSINNNPPAIAELRRIAPTVYTGYAGGDWRSNFELTAEALNLTDEADEVLAEYDARAEQIGAELADHADDTFSIVRWQGGSAALILTELPPGVALSDLGLKRPPNQDRRGRGRSEPVSLENLAEIDADYIFFGTLGGSSVGNPQAGGDADVSAAEEALAEAAQVPGFAQLEAYRSERIIPVDGSAWTSTGGPILMTTIIEAVREALVER